METGRECTGHTIPAPTEPGTHMCPHVDTPICAESSDTISKTLGTHYRP